MSPNRSAFGLTYSAICLCLFGVEAVAQSGEFPTERGDTVIVVQRDTLFQVRRDTVYVVQRDTVTEFAYARPAERARERKLRRRQERHDALMALDPVRTSQRAFAHFFYPTALLRAGFPELNYGLTYVNRGRWGASGRVGLHTNPRFLKNTEWRPERFGEARFGVRGVSLAVEGRYYVSDLREHEPLYLAVGLTGSVAPVVYETYLFDASRGFAEFGELKAKGKQWNTSLLIGWDGRYGKNFAAEVALGLEVGQRGIFADDPRNNRSLDGFNWGWNPVGNWSVYAAPFVRIGVGLGHW